MAVTVDITADLNDEDETGFVWTFHDEARDPGVIVPGAIVVAGDADAPAVVEVVDIVPKSSGQIVHLRILPGDIEDYAALVRRTLSPPDGGRTCGSRGADGDGTPGLAARDEPDGSLLPRLLPQVVL
jgi:hypothetical protein